MAGVHVGARAGACRFVCSLARFFVFKYACAQLHCHHFWCASYIKGWAGGIVRVDMLPKVAVDLPTYLHTDIPTLLVGRYLPVVLPTFPTPTDLDPSLWAWAWVALVYTEREREIYIYRYKCNNIYVLELTRALHARGERKREKWNYESAKI